MSSLDTLNQRRSVPYRQLGEPGPNTSQLHDLVEAACRVPDHGKLVPFRILAIEGAARQRLANVIAQRAKERNPSTPEAAIEKERERLSYAPLILTVIAKPVDSPKVPEIEQLMTAGCVCFSLLQGAQMLGFGAQWLTGAAATDDEVKRTLGVKPSEYIAGFIHIGTAQSHAPERVRPHMSDIFAKWEG